MRWLGIGVVIAGFIVLLSGFHQPSPALTTPAFASPVASPRAVDAACVGAAEWLADTTARMNRSNEIMGELIVNAQRARPGVDTSSEAGIARLRVSELEQLAESQRNSQPPTAAAGINATIADLFDAEAELMGYAATLLGGNANPLLQTATEAHLAESIEAVNRIDSNLAQPYEAFISRCDLV